jgi:restriction system protein
VRAWVVRGGRKGRFEQAALDNGIVALVWEEIPDISGLTEPAEIRALVEETFPGKSAYVVRSWTGHLWRFRSEMAVGDLVVLPRLGNRFAVGRITGDYAWRELPGQPGVPVWAHVRPVDWLRSDVSRTKVQPDLRDSLNSLLTVYQLRRNDAAERIAALALGLPDPGRTQSAAPECAFGSTAELLEAAAARDTDNPVVLSRRSLLELWGAQRRSAVVNEQSQRDLARTGLTTEPAISAGGLDGSIAIVPLGVDADEVEPEDAAGDAPPPPVSYLVNNLASACGEVVTVRAHQPLADAIELMHKHNYSQLPVLSAAGNLIGAVTWRSIVAAAGERLPGTVTDALTYPRTAHGTDSLLGVVSDIGVHGYVFVLDDSCGAGGGERVTGIVTSADLAGQFADRVTPFVLVEEIEQRLRGIVDGALAAGAITIRQLRDAVGDGRGTTNSAKDLTLGQYDFLFRRDELWKAFDLAAAQDLFLKLLFAAKRFRNNLMHFSPDPPSPGDLTILRGFLDLLRALTN